MSAKPTSAVTGRCFDGLENLSSLLLAVSGGPDSQALVHLAARWVSALPTSPLLHVATVDHGLRPEAAAEASMVATQAAALGLPHALLPWAGPKPTSRLQETARAARYGLLREHARRIGASHILTAHHADDQAETVLFRLGRGSGLTGLAGMRRLTPLCSDLWLCRPLLDVCKADLVAFCRAEAIPFVEDPSNNNPAFARARLRTHAAALAELGLDAPGLARFARRMARADEALEAETERIEADLHPTKGMDTYRVGLIAGRHTAPEIAVRLLRRAVTYVAQQDVAGPDRVIRLDRLEALAETLWLALRAGTPHRATLAGTRVVLDAEGQLEITREPHRRRGRPPTTDQPKRLD